MSKRRGPRGEPARFLYQKDGDRYVVYHRQSASRIGFVTKRHSSDWHWTDTYMAEGGRRSTRQAAAEAAYRATRAGEQG